MNSIGPSFGGQLIWGSGLPTPSNGVGIAWYVEGTSATDITDIPVLPGYPTSVVQTPSGTINVLEHPLSDNICGNSVGAVCLAPVDLGDAPVLTDAQVCTNSPENHGLAVYKLHGNRFNYLFFDNHVSILTMQQTVGSGSLILPKGMWTLAPND
jgi:prepilin-type processing-associated H-X9-DG protein